MTFEASLSSKSFKLALETHELSSFKKYNCIPCLIAVAVSWTANAQGYQLTSQATVISRSQDDSPPSPRKPEANRARFKFEKHGGVTYTTNGSESLTCDIYVPVGAGPFPAILAVHGGAWRSGSKLHLSFHARHMAARGYVVVAINYRHAPSSKFPLQVHDCKQAVRWLRRHASKYKIDPQRVAGWGYSAGGNLVALLGSTDAKDGLEGDVPASMTQYSTRLQAVVCGGAPYEFSWASNRLLEFWLGASRSKNPDVYLKASPLTYLDANDPPFFIYHGTGDLVVPVSTARKLKAKLDEVRVRSKLVIVDKRHLATFNDFDRLDDSLDFLDDIMSKTARKQVQRENK